MRKEETVGDTVRSLMELLSSGDGMERKQARQSLAAIGGPSVPSLCKALMHSRSDQTRWEAAKALDEIGDIRSIPSLVKALKDGDPDVAWLAAEALAKHERTAWVPILRALVKVGTDSPLLRKGAHHVFVKQRQEGYDDLLGALTKDLEPNAVSESSTVDAYAILKRMGARAGAPIRSVR